MCVFVLIDVRHTPRKLIWSLWKNFGEKGIPFVMVFTKADKLNPMALETNVEKYNAKMLENLGGTSTSNSSPLQPKIKGESKFSILLMKQMSSFNGLINLTAVKFSSTISV